MTSAAHRWSKAGLAPVFALGLAVIGCDPDPPPTPPPASPLIALTPAEYNTTIRDLLGMPMNGSAWPPAPPVTAKLGLAPPPLKGSFTGVPMQQLPWPWQFPPEVGVDDFDGMADGQEPSAYAIEELQKAAMFYASYALVSPLFFTCTDFGSLPEDEQAACGWASIERFAQRAWRRPISEAERARLQGFWNSNWQGGPPDEAVVWTVAGILQAPAFVFRVERGDVQRTQGDAVPLTGWEMASRLSYFLWDSMPDATLFAAAAKGELSAREGVEAQARRMLDDPRARAAVMRFHEQWLGTTRIHGISPARRVYGPVYGIAPEPPLDTTGDGEWPGILLPVRHSMEAETRLFVERTVFDGAGTLSALLTDNHGYMSSHTRPLYGNDAVILPGPTVTWRFGQVVSSLGNQAELTLYPTEFPPDQRAGLLTLPSVLALGAYPVHPAPILRGKRILERLGCLDLGTPPPGVEAAAPPDTATASSTNRRRTEAATSPPSCAGCHKTLNPPGFAFESYDAMGAWRTTDNGQPIDASGSVALSPEESFTFTGGVDLAQQLAASTTVRDCYALRWARYATGLQLPADNETVAELRETFRNNDRVKNLLIAIAGSDLFRYLRAGETP